MEELITEVREAAGMKREGRRKKDVIIEVNMRARKESKRKRR